MNENIIALISGLLSTIGASSIISGLVLRRIDKLERSLEKREADRVEESVSRTELLFAAGRLAKANTYALRTVTGEDACERELSAYQRASDALERFTREKTAAYLNT